MIVKPTPTKRAVIDPLRKCSAKCRMCYYLHEDLTSIFPLENMKNDLKKAKARGNNYFDVTGGEPFLYSHIIELLNFGHKLGMRSCIITSGLSKESRTKDVLDTGIDDFLVSVHGTEKVHDFIVQVEGARKKQIRFMEQIRQRMKFRFNCVISSMNQHEILDIAKFMSKWEPTIVNFINFNPHRAWRDKNLAREMVADLKIVMPQLDEAIDHLEEKSIGVNVRYYPMCKLKEDKRKNACNDLHVSLDKCEWDYDIQPKTLETFRSWGWRLSSGTEHHQYPCNTCDLEWICGGINKYFYNASSQKSALSPVKGSGIEDKNDFYHYRKHNYLTLAPNLRPEI